METWRKAMEAHAVTLRIRAAARRAAFAAVVVAIFVLLHWATH